MILEQDYQRRKISPAFESSASNWYADMPRFDGVTPLWMAAQMDNNHIIRLLLRAGASPTIPRNVRKCPDIFLFHLLTVALLIFKWRVTALLGQWGLTFRLHKIHDYDILSRRSIQFQLKQ